MEYDYYIIKMVGCVEPVLIGPFDTEREVLDRLGDYRQDPSECQNAFALMQVTKGAKVIL